VDSRPPLQRYSPHYPSIDLANFETKVEIGRHCVKWCRNQAKSIAPTHSFSLITRMSDVVMTMSA
jgi:hypothetical protein